MNARRIFIIAGIVSLFFLFTNPSILFSSFADGAIIGTIFALVIFSITMEFDIAIAKNRVKTDDLSIEDPTDQVFIITHFNPPLTARGKFIITKKTFFFRTNPLFSSGTEVKIPVKEIESAVKHRRLGIFPGFKLTLSSGDEFVFLSPTPSLILKRISAHLS